ncbi:MAG: TetR/AcrR family transcriptional regulator [Rhodococcus sp. (in: high G+C Gram-positive bacteria)]|uniref:TetR/AcrR family transcriptional regulator n=1 Tax=Rhodococcus sp. TaxID=1831 RepID=UPI002ADC7620|nr:TetR/AcrR family transcriptional regulator [Rhodococcus sp. (in: high G+C Gram-positive bacteria)]
MARYATDHKDATRRRLIDAAARRFKRDGLDGSGIASLVADVGLTNGAFYGHFTSKGDLVASVVADQLADQRAIIESLPDGPEGLEHFIREYLSPAHRDDRENGCPSAALLDEISRCDIPIRDAYTTGMRSILDLVAHHLDPEDPASSYDRATGLFTALICTLQLARALTDRELSDRVLAAGLTNALALAQPPTPLSSSPQQ